MQTFSTLTLFIALSAAVPHALNHFKLHERGLHAKALTPKSHVERDLEVMNLVKRQGAQPWGICGGTSGLSCAPGLCCSQYGFCGSGPEYCGNGDGLSFSPPSGGRPRPSPYQPQPAPPQQPNTPPTYNPPAPAPPSPPTGGSPGRNVYKFYSGDGSPASGWPSESDWMSFDDMWNANLPLIGISCSQFGQQNNSPQESTDLKMAIQSVSKTSGVDARIILATVMQESKGCVRVITTDNGVINPGLMQSHDGSGTCFNQATCSDDDIKQMIQDGTSGTTAGDGLEQTWDHATAADPAQRYYQAGVMYNSGNLPQNLDDNTATGCYASDIANRLTGWTDAPSTCPL